MTQNTRNGLSRTLSFLETVTTDKALTSTKWILINTKVGKICIMECLALLGKVYKMKLQLQKVMKPFANYTEQRHHLHFTLDIGTITQNGTPGAHECYCPHAVYIEKDTIFRNLFMSKCWAYFNVALGRQHKVVCFSFLLSLAVIVFQIFVLFLFGRNCQSFIDPRIT